MQLELEPLQDVSQQPLHTFNLTQQKRAIARSFGKAAQSYDNHAELQRQVGRELISKLPANLQGKKVLDLGCGTGYFSEVLIGLGAQVVCADLSEEMLQQAKIRCGGRADYRLADAECLPFEDNEFDFVFSSLALQWCEDLSQPLSEARRVTKAGGMVAVATLADRSLYELNSSWQNVDNQRHVNRFKTADLIQAEIEQCEFSKRNVGLQQHVTFYSSAVSLMRDLKGIGANLVVDRTGGSCQLTKSDLIQLESCYKAFRHENGLLPATYHVAYGVLTK